METDPGRTDDELFAVVDELRRENARLRGLLGLDGRADNGHEVAWAPTLLTSSSPPVSIDSSAPLSAKVALLQSLFGARCDVYGAVGERVERQVGLEARDEEWLVQAPATA